MAKVVEELNGQFVKIYSTWALQMEVALVLLALMLVSPSHWHGCLLVSSMLIAFCAPIVAVYRALLVRQTFRMHEN